MPLPRVLHYLAPPNIKTAIHRPPMLACLGPQEAPSGGSLRRRPIQLQQFSSSSHVHIHPPFLQCALLTCYDQNYPCTAPAYTQAEWPYTPRTPAPAEAVVRLVSLHRLTPATQDHVHNLLLFFHCVGKPTQRKNYTLCFGEGGAPPHTTCYIRI